MRKLSLSLLVLALPLAGAVNASAQDKPLEVSVGYAFAKYLEEDSGSAPVGAYLSLSGTKRVTLELDLGWQRDSLGESFALNTFTATLGPKFRWDTGSARPYFHALGGLRYDTIEGESNTSWGGQAGAGVDVKIGEKVALRLGADFQIFFEGDENVKTLRLLAGFTF